MHIPDGSIGPVTYISSYAVMIPVWTGVSRYLSKTLRTRQLPMLSLASAFSFVLMMFNIPAIGGGTSGHAIGAVLIAILMGPAAACLVITGVLAIQALLFGDGGITAIGANSLCMAVIMPYTGYGIYCLISHGSPIQSKRRTIAAGIAGYVGINLATLAAAILFGIQPLIAHNAAGKPLYAPYPLRIAIPGMMIPHLTLFGWIEAIVTGLAIAAIQKTEPNLLTSGEK